MQLQLPDRTLDLSAPCVMGILNVTPDSFSDGGAYPGVDAAVDAAMRMTVEGAAIIDVGGESTRPGAAPVGIDEELARVIPVIEALRARSDVVISVDTTKPVVMRAACAAGAELINDVNALRAAGALEVAHASRAAVCLMHMQGEPRTMQEAPDYTDVLVEVGGFLQQRVAVCEGAGIGRPQIVVDPGIGFGKTLAHNLDLLANLDALAPRDLPLLIGVSRKSMFSALLDRPPGARLSGSLAAAALAVWQRAVIVRAHDVAQTVDAVRLARALHERRKLVAYTHT
jgi:dihydropteroate synthase